MSRLPRARVVTLAAVRSLGARLRPLEKVPFVSRLPRAWVIALAAAVFVLVLGVPGIGYAAYNSGAFATFPAGTTVGGVDVSGMSRDEAVTAVRASVEKGFDRKVTVKVGDHTYSTSPRQLGVSSDVASAVDEALRLGSKSSWWDRLVGNADAPKVDVPVTKASKGKLGRLVHKAVRRAFDRPRNASVRLVHGAPEITKARYGRRVDPKEVRRAFRAAIADGRTHVVKPERVRAEITSRAYETVIVVNTHLNELYLFKDGRLDRTFPVATGMPGHLTPHGRFEVTLKRLHPTWVNPAPDGWGKDEPASIPPGPNSPLGLRALNISAPGIRVHGTPADWSIGHNASHGCIRMHNSDVLKLYPMVPTGTTVFIVGEGAPDLATGHHEEDPVVSHTEGR